MIFRGHAFSGSYDLVIWLLAPRPHHLPLVSSTGPVTCRKTEKERQLADGGVGRKEVGEEPNHTNARKQGPL